MYIYIYFYLFIYLCIASYVDTGEAEMNNECRQG